MASAATVTLNGRAVALAVTATLSTTATSCFGCRGSTHCHNGRVTGFRQRPGQCVTPQGKVAMDADARCSKVHFHSTDAGQGLKGGIDPLDATAAMHALDVEKNGLHEDVLVMKF